MVIRPPLHSDIETLVDLGAQLHQESAYSFLPYDRHKVRAFIGAYVEDRDTRCALVADDGGELIGVIGGALIEYYFCNEQLVSDEILFVRRDHRNGMAAIALIRGLQKWAIARGARELCLSISSNVNQEITGKLFERLGFERMGGIFKMRLEGG